MNSENWKQTDEPTHGTQTPSDASRDTADRRKELETGKHEKARDEKQGNDQKTAIKDAPNSSGR